MNRWEASLANALDLDILLVNLYLFLSLHFGESRCRNVVRKTNHFELRRRSVTALLRISRAHSFERSVTLTIQNKQRPIIAYCLKNDNVKATVGLPG